jgi:crotonobetainyl-CoA hydratase
MTNPVKTERRGAVLEVTLDRPKANAIDAATSRIMGDVFASFRDDPELRVAILTGGGERFFCAGWDLKAAAGGEAPDSDYGVGGFGGLQELPDMNKPVIAAVNGMAFGGGFELMISCDIILAAEDATFALPEIRSGTIADAATVKLPRRIPYHVAMELLFTGRWMDADEAERWGLVNEIVPTMQLMNRAREVADLLASGPPLVYAAIKEVDRMTGHLPVQEAMDMLNGRKLKTIDTLYSSEDQLEGAKAFAENGPAGRQRLALRPKTAFPVPRRIATPARLATGCAARDGMAGRSPIFLRSRRSSLRRRSASRRSFASWNLLARTAHNSRSIRMNMATSKYRILSCIANPRTA